jgi:hypothetical protein
MKIYKIFMAVVLGLMIAYGLSHAGMVMESSVYDEHTRPLVEWNHESHANDYDIDCKVCHHTMKEGDECIESCAYCHNKPRKPRGIRVSREERVKRFHYDAIHDSCMGCHKSLKREAKSSGPTSCRDCHIK